MNVSTILSLIVGIFIEDVREVLPNCVVADVRKRWPNPPDMPYKGHVPTL